jgi:4-hydroxy-tetrahydrodipicolinate synthase
MQSDFKGILAVLSTPFTKDDKIDEAALRSHVRYLIDEGHVHGVIPNGSTGEFILMSEEEQRLVTKTVVDEVNGKIPVIIGTAAASTSETIRKTVYAQEIGADGAMIVPSYYCHPNEDEIYGHYQAVINSVDIPIILYNNPSTSGVDMSAEFIAKLAEFDQLTHIKESTGDMTRATEIQMRCGDKLNVLCGCDTLCLEMFLMGAGGYIAPGANIIPKQLVELYDLAVVKKDFDAAKQLYFKLLPLFHLFEGTGQYIQLSKAGLDILGRNYGDPRKPLLPVTAELNEELRKILKSLDLC